MDNSAGFFGTQSFRWGLGEMRRILVCLFFSLLLVCSLVGLRNLVAQSGSDTPVVMAIGGAPPPPIPDWN